MGAMIQEFVHAKTTFERDAANQGQAGLAASTNDWMSKNPAAGADALKTSFEQLATSITAPGVQALGPALTAAAQGVQTFAPISATRIKTWWRSAALLRSSRPATAHEGALRNRRLWTQRFSVSARRLGRGVDEGGGCPGRRTSLNRRRRSRLGGRNCSRRLGRGGGDHRRCARRFRGREQRGFRGPFGIARLKADDARKQANFDRDGSLRGSLENMFGAPGDEIRRPAPAHAGGIGSDAVAAPWSTPPRSTERRPSSTHCLSVRPWTCASTPARSTARRARLIS